MKRARGRIGFLMASYTLKLKVCALMDARSNDPDVETTRFGIARYWRRLPANHSTMSRHTANAVLRHAGIPKQF